MRAPQISEVYQYDVDLSTFISLIMLMMTWCSLICIQNGILGNIVNFSNWILTLRTRALVLVGKIVIVFSNFWHFNVYSRINEPIPGMFVLSWMHFSWWFQIWKSTMLTFFTKYVTFMTCRLHSPAAWKALTFWINHK